MVEKQNLFGRFYRFIGAELLIGLSAAIISLVLFLWLADEVLEGETILFDNSVRLFVHQFASPLMTGLMQTMSFIGSTVFLVSLGTVVVIWFAFAGWKRAIALFLINMAGAIALLITLKINFQRTRPEPYFDTPLPSSFSFPSGHSLSSLCFFGVLAWLVTARIENRAVQIGVWVLAVLLILLIGVSRIYLGVHYPTDVLAGYAAALVWVCTVSLGDFLVRRRYPKTEKVI